MFNLILQQVLIISVCGGLCYVNIASYFPNLNRCHQKLIKGLGPVWKCVKYIITMGLVLG